MTCREVRWTSGRLSTVNRAMIRLATALFGLAAVAAGMAAADGQPTPSITTNSLFAPGGRMYTTAVHARRTTVSLWHGTDKARRSRARRALWDSRFRRTTGTGEGISHDGRTLLLASGSRYVSLDARSLAVRRDVRLRGQFSYDALSPTGRTLFLIQHPSPDLAALLRPRLRPRPRDGSGSEIVFDAREKGEGPMTGSPVTRATGPTGRWIYTLYVRPSGALFVHALDSVDVRAFCVDLPRRGSGNVMHTKLELKPRQARRRRRDEAPRRHRHPNAARPRIGAPPFRAAHPSVFEARWSTSLFLWRSGAFVN